MADKDITIGIHTSGAEQSAAEIRKVEDATEDLARAQNGASGGFNGQLDYVPKKRLAEASKELAEANREEASSIFAAFPAKELEIQMAEDLATAKKNLAAATDAGRISETAAAAAEQIAGGDISGAVRTVASNPAAIAGVKAFAAETGVVLGTVTAAYVTMTSSFGGVKQQFDELGAAYPEFEEKNRALGATLEALSSPFATACRIIKDLWADTASFISNTMDTIVLNNSISAVKNAVSAKKMADDLKVAYDAQAAAHKAMLERMESEDMAYLQKYMAMEDKIAATQLASKDRIATAKEAAAAAEDKRAGLSQGEQSVNGVGRMIEADHRAEDQAQQALDVADRNLAQALSERKGAAEKDVQRLDAAIIAAEGAQSEAGIKLRETYELAGIKEQEAVKAASDEVTRGTQTELTKLAAAAKAELQAKADAAGGQISSSAKAALDGLVKIMADGVIKPEEIATLRLAMDQMHASREAANSEILKALRATMTSDNRLQQQIDQLATQINQAFTRGR